MDTNLHYLTFDEVGITVAVIGIALAFVVLVWNAVKAIHDWRQLAKKPTEEVLADHEERISHLEACCEDVHGKLAGDYEFMVEEKEFNKLMLESIAQLLKHSIDGNDRDGLQSMESRINKYLLDKM